KGAAIRDFEFDTSLAIIYAVSPSGLFIKDTLPGSAWNKVTSFPTTPTKIFIDRKNRVLVAGNAAGVYQGTVSGTTWAVDSAGMGFQSIRQFADDAYGNHYALTTSSKIFYSKSGTKAWKQIDAGIANKSVNPVTI